MHALYRGCRWWGLVSVSKTTKYSLILNVSLVKTTPSPSRQQPLSQSSTARNATPNSVASSSETESHGYMEHPYPSGPKQRSDPLASTMPNLPEPLLPSSFEQPKMSTDDVPKKPATYNPEAYPKFPGM